MSKNISLEDTDTELVFQGTSGHKVCGDFTIDLPVLIKD